jgi:tight adherence protein C
MIAEGAFFAWSGLASVLCGASAACLACALLPHTKPARERCPAAAKQARTSSPAGLTRLSSTLAGAGAAAALAIMAQADALVIAAACAAGGFAGACLAPFIRKAGRRRRQLRVAQALPFGADLVAVGLSAGLTVEAAILRAAAETAPFAPDLSDDLFGLGLKLRRRGAHHPGENSSAEPGALCPQWQAFSTILLEGERHGLACIGSLRTLASSLRENHYARHEEAAAKLGPRLTIPLILFFLPPLFLILLTPSLLSVLHHLK